ncbi:MAG: ketoacyl-ACP synthase III [Bacteroidales bacterium]|nr:ketoacyl-ACP synthase III [Bacteroidales bacterium]
MRNINAVITGVGGYVPEKVITNEDICKLVDSSDEWITSRTGIKERRMLDGDHVGASFMGERAVKELLKNTGTNPEDVDAIICSTSTPDYIFPATAAIIADKCGIKNAFAYDLSAACSGFIFSMVNASGLVESGRYKKVIVVAAEKMTCITNYTDRTTCPLFGDAAAAILLEPTTENLGMIDSVMHTDGSGFANLHMKAGGSVYPASHETIDRREHSVYQEGQAVFKMAVNKLVEANEEIKTRNNLTSEDVTWVVPHQANMRIIDAIVRYMDVPMEKVMVNIQKYGNTSSASIPICLWEWENKLKKGDTLILSAFGAGFSWGSIYLKWGYNPK